MKNVKDVITIVYRIVVLIAKTTVMAEGATTIVLVIVLASVQFLHAKQHVGIRVMRRIAAKNVQ